MNTASTQQPCGYCGNHHAAKCPLVRSIEYFENGMVKRVEFMRPGDYLQPITPMPNEMGRTMFGIPMEPLPPITTFTGALPLNR